MGSGVLGAVAGLGTSPTSCACLRAWPLTLRRPCTVLYRFVPQLVVDSENSVVVVANLWMTRGRGRFSVGAAGAREQTRAWGPWLRLPRYGNTASGEALLKGGLVVPALACLSAVGSRYLQPAPTLGQVLLCYFSLHTAPADPRAEALHRVVRAPVCPHPLLHVSANLCMCPVDASAVGIPRQLVLPEAPPQHYLPLQAIPLP